MDVTWVGSYEPNLKRQPNEWKHPGSPRRKNTPYTMCYEGDVHCGGWRWGDAAPRCISKVEGKRCLLLQFLQQHFHAALKSRLNDDAWWYRTPSFYMTIQGVTPLQLSRTSCAADLGRFWNIHLTHPTWVHAITISSPKWTRYTHFHKWLPEINKNNVHPT